MTKFSDFIRFPGTAGPPTQQGIYALGFALRNEIVELLGKFVRVDAAQSFSGPEKTMGQENLGVKIGTDVQAYSAALTSIAGLTTVADRLPYATAADTYGVTTLTAFARTMLDDADAVALRATIGLDNVDNTSDADKPISTATQNALDLKAPLASPALTGTPTAPTAAPGTNSTQIATTAFAAAIDATIKAPTRTIVSGGTSDVAGTYNPPAGCTKIRVQLQAAGGGGGYGKSTAGNAAVGGGGGGGQWADKIIAPPAASYAYSLGANGKGGIASSSTAATAANNSTFGSGPAILTCGGGGGGGSSSATTVSGGSTFGGNGGTGASGGDLSVAGGRGGYGIVFSGSIAFSGAGGDALLGAGSFGAGDGSSPIAGSGYGAGGTGGVRTNGAQSDGADGARAVLIIDEYYD